MLRNQYNDLMINSQQMAVYCSMNRARVKATMIKHCDEITSRAFNIINDENTTKTPITNHMHNVTSQPVNPFAAITPESG